MRRLLALLLLASPCLAGGPKYVGTKTDATIYQEFQNVYQDIKNPVIQSGTASTFTVTQLNVSTLSAITANLNNINGTFIGLGRNRIINGDMSIDQRNEGQLVTPTASGLYGCDRWISYNQGSPAVFKTQRLTTTPPTGFSYYTHFTVTTASAAPAGVSIWVMAQYIEGYNFKDFLPGTSSAAGFTVSFWVRSSLTGTFAGSFSNKSNARSYPFNYSVSSANTWEKKTIYVPGDTTGTYDITNGVGLVLYFDLGSSSTYDGTLNSWQAGLFLRTSGANRLIASTSNTLDITGVQLEIGSTASAFEFTPVPLQILQCQRYYEKTYVIGVSTPGAATATNLYLTTQTQTGTNNTVGMGFMQVTKRSAPTVVLYTIGGTSGNWTCNNTAGAGSTRALAVGDAGTKMFDLTNSVALEYICYGHYTADSDF